MRAAAAAAIEQQNEQARLLQQEDAERVRQAAAAAAKIQDALYYLQTGIRDPAAAHAASRTSGDWVEQVRREFDALKKTGTKFKVDLKKCTAFCKRVKSGALYNNNSNAINIATPTVSAPTTAGSSSGGGTTAATTANPSLAATATAAAIASIQDDMAALNLSRHVEEVLAAVLDSHPKVPDVPLVTALAIAMHTRYPEFLPMLVPALWNVVWPSSNSNSSSSSSKLASAPPESGSSGADATKQRRVYVRLLTEFLLHGLLSASDVTKLLQKCLGEWTSMTPTTADGVSLAVALCKTAGFEVLGQASTTTRTAMELLRSEHQKHQQEQQQQQSGQTESDNTKEGESTSPPLPNAATIDYGLLLEQGMALVHELEPILAHQRAVSEEMTASVRQHLLGTYQTLCALHVSSNQKLQKLEKRCHQDRLVSGSLTAQREKGLADAHKICDSLRKSVEVLADGLDEPMPHVSSTQDDRDGDENGTLTGTGVEVWTKESGGQENLGPFDDEETRAFYCDIPDLLTTIPPALLGISDDEIERRKEANAIKYGLGGASAVDDSSAAADAVVLPTSEAQLDAAEQGEILAEDEEVGEKMDGKTVLVSSNCCSPLLMSLITIYFLL